MKKNIFRTFLAMVMISLCLFTCGYTAFADSTVSVSLPVKITASGNRPSSPETYTLKLQADEPDFPMPAGSKDGVYTLGVRGPVSSVFPAIVFDRVGVYTYTVFQAKGSNSSCTYDSAVYVVKITVSYGADGSSLEAAIAMYPAGAQVKTAQAEFVNKYAYPPTDTPKTGDEAEPALYVSLCMLSLSAMLVCIFFMKHSRKMSSR